MVKVSVYVQGLFRRDTVPEDATIRGCQLFGFWVSRWAARRSLGMKAHFASIDTVVHALARAHCLSLHHWSIFYTHELFTAVCARQFLCQITILVHSRIGLAIILECSGATTIYSTYIHTPQTNQCWPFRHKVVSVQTRQKHALPFVTSARFRHFVPYRVARERAVRVQLECYLKIFTLHKQ